MLSLAKVVLVGGPDKDARLELMHCLKDSFNISALGLSPELYTRFLTEGFDYSAYRLGRKANPLSDLITVGQLLFILSRLEPDIVHTFDSKPGVWVRLAARLAGVPVIIGTLPGLGSPYSSDRLITRLIRFAYERVQVLTSCVIDQTIFQDSDNACQLVAADVVPHERTAVILGSEIAPSKLRLSSHVCMSSW